MNAILIDVSSCTTNDFIWDPWSDSVRIRFESSDLNLKNFLISNDVQIKINFNNGNYYFEGEISNDKLIEHYTANILHVPIKECSAIVKRNGKLDILEYVMINE